MSGMVLCTKFCFLMEQRRGVSSALRLPAYNRAPASSAACNERISLNYRTFLHVWPIKSRHPRDGCNCASACRRSGAAQAGDLNDRERHSLSRLPSRAQMMRFACELRVKHGLRGMQACKCNLKTLGISNTSASSARQSKGGSCCFPNLLFLLARGCRTRELC